MVHHIKQRPLFPIKNMAYFSTKRSGSTKRRSGQIPTRIVLLVMDDNVELCFVDFNDNLECIGPPIYSFLITYILITESNIKLSFGFFIYHRIADEGMHMLLIEFSFSEVELSD